MMKVGCVYNCFCVLHVHLNNRVTTCLDNLEMSGILTVVKEIS